VGGTFETTSKIALSGKSFDMAANPIKFRCYRCNQLLGTGRSKAGAVIACPKCSAELIVPAPDETTTVEGGSETPDRRAGTPGTLDQGLSLDLLDIRPEDIRVEPGIAYEPLLPDAAPPEDEAPFDEGVSETIELPAAVVAPPLPPPPQPPAPIKPIVAPPPAPVVPAPVIAPVEAPLALEPIKTESARSGSIRSRDVILPRSAVAAWSLFVLLAQGLAFIAGLLAGHYLWRVH
jgi:phage FluMu protein Com